MAFPTSIMTVYATITTKNIEAIPPKKKKKLKGIALKKGLGAEAPGWGAG